MILLFQGLHLSQIPVLRLFWRCISFQKKNIRIYHIYFCTFAKTIILLPSLMQSFNLKRLQDSQTQPAAQFQNVGPLPLQCSIPPKTPRCINPLVEARWAPAIVGSDRIMGDISGSRSKGPLRTLFPMKFMFTSKTKTHHDFTHSISIISDPFHANP